MYRSFFGEGDKIVSRELRKELFKDNIILRKDTEKICIDYFHENKEKNN